MGMMITMQLIMIGTVKDSAKTSEDLLQKMKNVSISQNNLLHYNSSQ